MPRKFQTTHESTPKTVNEPAVAYQITTPKIKPSAEWNPNVPFHGTQEEWWEHFHCIEEGNFETWEEHQKRFYAWKKECLASLI